MTLVAGAMRLTEISLVVSAQNKNAAQRGGIFQILGGPIMDARRDAALPWGREYRSHAVRACGPAYGRDGRLRPSAAPSFPTASRNSCGASFRGRRLHAEASFSAHEAPDPHCYHERLLASANRPFDFKHQCWSVASGPKNPSADRQSRSPLAGSIAEPITTVHTNRAPRSAILPWRQALRD